jgi:uncharacterized protein (TIGR04141 family)
MTKKTSRRDGKPKTRHLTFLLIRADRATPEAALGGSRRLESVALPPEFEFEGRLYLWNPEPKEPRWGSFLREGFEETVQLTQNSTVAAVLFVQVGTRLFAVTFGQGRHLLHPDAFELDFGLKVTLNSVDEKKLRSLDLRTFEELTLHTRRQVSRSSSLEAFSIDVSRDLLGSVTGEPSDGTLAKRFTGRDALVFTGPLAFSELAARCKRFLTQYQSTVYKERFAWVDNIRRVKDTHLLGELDAALVQRLNERDLDKIHLAPPEVLDWNEGLSFLYPGESSRPEEAHSDLDLEECLTALAVREDKDPEGFELSLETLKKGRIRTMGEDGAAHAEHWSIYHCLVAELSREEALYILSAGQWFKIEKTFAQRILENTKRLVKQIDHLPTAKADEEEGAYNARAANDSKTQLALLDKKNKKAKGARTAIEACDLLSSSGQFIHVKRKLRSSSLSHLFAQGTVAAETFFNDAKFRGDVKKEVDKQTAWGPRVLGDAKVRPDASHYEVVFAIITPPGRLAWPQALPFFSQLNLDRAATRLRTLGLGVALYRIEERK